MTAQSVVVKRIKDSLQFDVFTKDGWMNWSRVAWNMKEKRLTLIKGQRLNSIELKTTYELVEAILHHQQQKEPQAV